MKKFAFLVHLRDYQNDLAEVWPPLGWLPDSVYRLVLDRRPLPPMLWSEVGVTPYASEAEGFLIILPYSGRQILEQARQMQPLVRKAIRLGVSRGANILGLGALTSPITLGGRLIAGNRYLSVTNGNAFTALILHQQLMQAVAAVESDRPKIAIAGATGSVGSLVCRLLARGNPEFSYQLIARNTRQLRTLSAEMKSINRFVTTALSTEFGDLGKADIVLLVTSAPGNLLDVRKLKQNAIVIDATQPRNTDVSSLAFRPDVIVIDGGLVEVKYLKTNRIGRLGLPEGIAFACLAETMLLSLADYNKDFSIGSPDLKQADTIAEIARDFAGLGFTLAPPHSFGRPLVDFSPNRITGFVRPNQ